MLKLIQLTCYSLNKYSLIYFFKMHFILNILKTALVTSILLLCTASCGQKGPLIVEQPPVEQQDEPVEETK